MLRSLVTCSLLGLLPVPAFANEAAPAPAPDAAEPPSDAAADAPADEEPPAGLPRTNVFEPPVDDREIPMDRGRDRPSKDGSHDDHHHRRSIPPARGPAETDPVLLQAASNLMEALRSGDVQTVLGLVRAPFRLESEELGTEAALRDRLTALVERRTFAQVPLFGVEVLPATAMIARHGAPPARLGTLEPKDTWVAVGNLGGHALVAVFRREGRAWKAVALTD